ncbi:UNVERIFIED_CONTAM: hypothetical protein PYX00_006826 [Menopon gallinae]|uniref:Cyclic nucleotide-binding domain-containing protein n=1 Tax=Menopon gallinae TaxID=328185 RepID=A0AAW2HWQ0_9NEOP
MMLSRDSQRQSRSELQLLISEVNRSRKSLPPKRSPKFRFMAAVRAVINNLRWLTEETSPAPGDLPTKGPKLTQAVKGLLRTMVDERTSEDMNHIYRVIGNISALQRYPERVREKLTASCTFVYQGPNRVIVKEGQPSWNMYVILSGQVSVTKMMYDAGDKVDKPFEVATMTAGDFFGEINILHGEPWPTTITTVTHTEFLRVAKWHFQKILEKFLGEQKEEITRCLSKFAYFKDWNNRTILECCILSRVQHFPKDELILGDRVGNFRSSYFIVSGECVVMYHLVAEVDERDNTESIHKEFEVHEEDTFPVSRLLRGLHRERMHKIGEPHLANLIADQTLEKLINELPLPLSRTALEADGLIAAAFRVYDRIRRE